MNQNEDQRIDFLIKARKEIEEAELIQKNEKGLLTAYSKESFDLSPEQLKQLADMSVMNIFKPSSEIFADKPNRVSDPYDQMGKRFHKPVVNLDKSHEATIFIIDGKEYSLKELMAFPTLMEIAYMYFKEKEIRIKEEEIKKKKLKNV